MPVVFRRRECQFKTGIKGKKIKNKTHHVRWVERGRFIFPPKRKIDCDANAKQPAHSLRLSMKGFSFYLFSFFQSREMCRSNLQDTKLGPTGLEDGPGPDGETKSRIEGNVAEAGALENRGSSDASEASNQGLFEDNEAETSSQTNDWDAGGTRPAERAGWGGEVRIDSDCDADDAVVAGCSAGKPEARGMIGDRGGLKEVEKREVLTPVTEEWMGKTSREDGARRVELAKVDDEGSESVHPIVGAERWASAGDDDDDDSDEGAVRGCKKATAEEVHSDVTMVGGWEKDDGADRKEGSRSKLKESCSNREES